MERADRAGSLLVNGGAKKTRRPPRSKTPRKPPFPVPAIPKISCAGPADSRNPQEVARILEKWLVGRHEVMKRARAELAAHVSSTKPLLIRGESGTGKMQAALGLHEAGPRRAMSLVLAPMGSLTPTLMGSELFGHRKGAFTGAQFDRKGYFVEARGTDLLLDDVPECPPEIQSALLIAVEYGRFRPVGSDVDEVSDARIISTTNKPLDQEVEAKRFRFDLYQRLAVNSVFLPPLRSHPGDIPLYIGHFQEKTAREAKGIVRDLNDGALNALSGYGWPGNVRELQSVLSRAFLAATGEAVTGDDIRRAIRPDPEEVTPERSGATSPTPMDESTRLQAALEAWRWNIKRTAKELGMSRRTLYRKMARLGIRR